MECLAIPTPTFRLQGLDGLRRLPEMARDPLAFFTSLHQEQGPIASFDFALGRQWLISDPDAIRTVFETHHEDLVRDAATMTLKPVFGRGILTSDGAAWRRMRRMHGGLFKARHIRHYGEQMVRVVGREGQPEAGLVDVHPEMTRITRQIFLDTMFGSDASAADAIADAVTTSIAAHEREFMSLRRFYPSFLPTPGRRQAARGRRQVAACLAPLIAQRRAMQDEHDQDGLDMLTRLIVSRDEEGGSLTDTELQDVVATLYFGGTETSANALSFALWLLALRPDVQDALAEERAEVLGDRVPGVGDMRALARHTAVIDEAMRLYPPVWALGRRVTRGFEVNGHQIRAGDQLNASPWVVHRDPRWFVRPHAFLPERFWDPTPNTRPRHAYFPFGAGQRNCLGSHFARMEMVLVLAGWLAKRRLHPVPDRAMNLLPRVSLRPVDGAWVDVEVLP